MTIKANQNAQSNWMNFQLDKAPYLQIEKAQRFVGASFAAFAALGAIGTGAAIVFTVTPI